MRWRLALLRRASSLSDFRIVGCEATAAVHFSPSSCPIAWLWGGKSGKNCPRWGGFSLSTPKVRQAASSLSDKAISDKSRRFDGGQGSQRNQLSNSCAAASLAVRSAAAPPAASGLGAVACK